MKRLVFTLLTTLLFCFGCTTDGVYDDSDLSNRIDELEDRVDKLEDLCKEMNTNIASLQTIVSALQKNDYIKSITPIVRNGETIGYTIIFANSEPVTIYHGENGKDGVDGVNGQDGKDGSTPQVGVKQYIDGIYYWTINGEWLLDEHGNKIKATGADGQNGADGENGQNGADGKDGVTPQLKIEDNYWYVSYDNGTTWTKLGKATGEDGKDGNDGADGADGEDGKDGSDGADGTDGSNGDSIFQSIDTSNPDYILFTLTNGTVIKIPTWGAFEQLKQMCNEMNANIVALQSIVNALQENDYITSVTPLMENGAQIGYTITFAKSGSIVIYHGKDGADGKDGANGTNGSNGSAAEVPVIGVKQYTDGCYYWTLNGEWLLDDNGNKVRASAIDGKDGADGTNGSNGQDGQNGSNGADGKDGADGITPQLKIEEGYWYVSYDNGSTWTKLGKATGEDGKDGQNGEDGKDGVNGSDGKDGVNGADGKDGDSFFQSVTENEDYVVFTLADGTTFNVPKSKPFSITFDTDTIKFSLGCTYTINYTINGADELTSMQVMTSDGLRASYEHGTLDNGTLSGVISVTTPKTLVERTSIAVLVSDGRSRVLMQALNFVYEGVNDIADGVLIITAGQALAVGCEGGTIEVPLQTNMNYYVEIDDTAASWLSPVATLSRATLREETLRFSASKNNGGERYGFVYLKSVADNSLIQTLCITQHANETVLAEVINFADPNFEACALAVCDFDSSGTITKAEALEVVALSMSSKSITDLRGLEHFTNLTSLNISSNSGLKSVDLSALTKLETLDCNRCTGLTSLDVTKNVVLRVLNCQYATFTSLDLSKNMAIESLDLYLAKEIKALDLSDHSQIKYVNVAGDKYTTTNLISLKVTGCSKLETLKCGATQISTLDISSNKELRLLNCATTSLTHLDTSKNAKLQELNVSGTPLRTLNVSHNSMLNKLYVAYNPFIEEINLGNNRRITSLELIDDNSVSRPVRGLKIIGSELETITYRTSHTFERSPLGELDLSQAPNITSLSIESAFSLRELDLSNLSQLKSLILSGCYALEGVDVSKNTELVEFHYASSNSDCLLEKIDFSNNKKLQTVKFQGCNISELDLSNNLQVNNLNLLNTPKLQLLNLGDNIHITRLNSIGKADNIKIVSKYLNMLTNGSNVRLEAGSSIDVTECPNLSDVRITSNKLQSIDLSKNPKLWKLNMECSNLVELDLSNNPELISVTVHNQNYNSNEKHLLEKLNISGCSKLQTLEIWYNYLETLDLSTNTALTTLKCWGNNLKILDVSNCPALTLLDCSPMDTLETVYVDATQRINHITYDRSNDYIPAATSVVVR